MNAGLRAPRASESAMSAPRFDAWLPYRLEAEVGLHALVHLVDAARERPQKPSPADHRRELAVRDRPGERLAHRRPAVLELVAEPRQTREILRAVRDGRAPPFRRVLVDRQLGGGGALVDGENLQAHLAAV